MLKRNSLTAYLGAFLSLLLLWCLVSALSKLPFLPSPFTVFMNLYEIFYSQLLLHTLYSLWRVFAGILLSVVIGILTGLCMGYFDRCDRLLSPVVYFLYPIPKIALLPIIMLLFGLGELSKIFMIAVIVVFQVIVASRDAVKTISRETFHSMYSLGASSFQIFRKVIFPASLPGLLTSLRVSLGTAISVLFFTETFGTQYGMGFFIMDAWMRVNYTDMFSGILMLSMMGFALFLTIDLLEKVVCKWKN